MRLIPVFELPLLEAAFLPFVSTSLATTFDFLASTCLTEGQKIQLTLFTVKTHGADICCTTYRGIRRKES